MIFCRISLGKQLHEEQPRQLRNESQPHKGDKRRFKRARQIYLVSLITPLVQLRMAPRGQRDERCAARAAPPPFPLYTPPPHPLSSQNALQDKLASVRSSVYLTKAVFCHTGGAISKC